MGDTVPAWNLRISPPGSRGKKKLTATELTRTSPARNWPRLSKARRSSLASKRTAQPTRRTALRTVGPVRGSRDFQPLRAGVVHAPVAQTLGEDLRRAARRSVRAA